MIFRFLLTVGFIPLILLTEAAAATSNNSPNGKVYFYSRHPGNEASVEFMEDTDSKFRGNTMNYYGEDGNSASLFPDDQKQCQIKQPIMCDPSYPYRTMNGSCNNLAHPTWGVSNGCYLRFQPAFYDGKDQFRKSVTGNPLPEPRDIIVNIFKDVHRPSTKVSFMFTVYGQILAHDLSRAEVPNLDTDCCSPESYKYPYCAAISVRPNDPFFAQYNQTCLFMHRTEVCKPCSAYSTEQVNAATSSLDASIVYGSDDRKAKQIRTYDGTGKLLSNQTANGEILPTDDNAPKLFCPLQRNCFLTGDKRVNQHAFLSAMETIFMREHNRVATELKKLNPHWKEEILYQEARRIVIANLQCITYKEYLPELLGPYIMRKFDLGVRNTSGGTKFKPNLQIGVRNEFANAGFRLHSMIPTKTGTSGFKFRHAYQHPELIINGHLDEMAKGACKVPSEKYDHHDVIDATEYLGLYAGIQFGTDLASIDIQRGRDHGLAPYVVMVRFCSNGRVNIKTFDDLAPLLMPQKRAEMLKRNYASVEDVDLYVGMQLEHIFPGSEVGPTAVCLISKQFYFTKFGDRFYFEHEGQVPSFTKAQRNSLKQCSLARVLCENLNITNVQKFPMRIPSPENSEVSCEDIPKIDLKYWRKIS